MGAKIKTATTETATTETATTETATTETATTENIDMVQAKEFIVLSQKTRIIVSDYIIRHGIGKASSAFSAALIAIYGNLDAGISETDTTTARTIYNRFKQMVSEFRKPSNRTERTAIDKAKTYLKQLLAVLPDCIEDFDSLTLSEIESLLNV